MEKVGSKLIFGDPVGRCLGELAELADLAQISLAGVFALTGQVKIIAHAGVERVGEPLRFGHEHFLVGEGEGSTRKVCPRRSNQLN